MKAGCTQSGESDDKVYIQCFAQTPAGLYDIAILDGSADKVKVVVNDAVRTAPFNVDEPDLADVVAFGQDVRPKP